MLRREFLETMALMTPPAGHSAPFYTLDSYQLENGAAVPALHRWLREEYLPSLERPALVLEAVVAAHLPQVVVVRGHATLEAAVEPPGWPVEGNVQRTLLQATAYCPEPLAAGGGSAGRIFELRLYHAPTWPQLQALHERFAGPEIPIFHRVGVWPVLYTSTILGPRMPNLVYLTPFESLAARETAWNAFAADPEWHRVRDESIARSGQIAQVIEISLFRAAAYSPIR